MLKSGAFGIALGFLFQDIGDKLLGEVVANEPGQGPSNNRLEWTWPYSSVGRL